MTLASPTGMNSLPESERDCAPVPAPTRNTMTARMSPSAATPVLRRLSTVTV